MEITKEEILKLAELSALTLQDDEIVLMQRQIQTILTYAKRVNELAHKKGIAPAPSLHEPPCWREDIAHESDCQKILGQAPESAENLFIVPRILEG